MDLPFIHFLFSEILTNKILSTAAIAVFFIMLIYTIHRAEKLEWSDLITAKNSKKVSLTKFLQFTGGIVATWIVVRMTIMEVLTWDIFATYLAYVASSEGFSKFIAAKYGIIQKDDKEKE